MKWRSFDPAWLIDLAAEQHPSEKWLLAALAQCTSVSIESPTYYHFVDPSSPAWRFERNIVLHHKREGEIVLDVLQGKQIGGIEFLRRL